MTRSATVLVWVVSGTVLLTASALWLRALPEPLRLETVLPLLLGVCLMAGVIALSLHFSKRRREADARAVARIDATLRVFAQQTGHRFEEGGGYSHPMVGFIPYSGRVVGGRGALRFKVYVAEDEGSYELTVSVTPVPGKARRLKSQSRDLPARAASLVAALAATCGQIAVERTTPWLFGNARSERDREIEFELVCRASAKLEELIAPERLRFTLENALALADALSRP